ncbi:hypothetical protein Mapa_014607 [Marchantia paleacea]|nr:hypothetical protein Mapa_014607 [Marchantia paleacea]
MQSFVMMSDGNRSNLLIDHGGRSPWIVRLELSLIRVVTVCLRSVSEPCCIVSLYLFSGRLLRNVFPFTAWSFAHRVVRSSAWKGKLDIAKLH